MICRWTVRSVIFLASVALFCSPAVAQPAVDSAGAALLWDFPEEQVGFSVLRLLADVVTPETVRDTRRIRAYVEDPRFGALRQRDGDLRAADAIYLRSLRIAEYDIGRALMLSLLASLEHRHLPLRLPGGGTVSLPLSLEEEERFRVRVANLPRHLYADSPRDEQSDRDKLQHFFAAAVVAYATESPDVAEAAGDFVEWGEAIAVVGGVDDPRDRRSNAQGELFGHDLLYIKTMLPSDYLRLRVTDQ
jgi:hypothetical protein